MAKPRSLSLLHQASFGLLAALVIVAVVIPAGAAAGVAMFLLGYLLGLGNRTIGLLGLLAWLPLAALAFQWLWPELKAFAMPADSGAAQ